MTDSSESAVAPARLLLIRHGQTAGNVAQRLRGPENGLDPLSERGEQQARQLAAALARLPLGRVRLYASPYLRAQQTARPSGEALGVQVRTLEGAQEISTGSWQGRPYADMHEKLGEMVAPDGEFGFPGGESLSGVAGRFHAALLEVLPAPGETVIVVSHGAALTALLARLTGVDYRAAWADRRFSHDNAAVSELVWSGTDPASTPPQLLRVADAGHLQQLV